MKRFLSLLRPYQKECIDASIAHYNDGLRKMAVSLPVGSGKTVVFSNLIKSLNVHGKTLIIAHREELLYQAYNQCIKFLPDSRISFDQGIKKPDAASDIIIASVNSLGRRGSNRLHFYDPKEFKCIIIDEAHHAAAQSYLRILDHFEIDHPENKILVCNFPVIKRKWGCSATLFRNDKLGLRRAFDKIVYTKHIGDLIHEKYLSDMIIDQVKTKTQLNDIEIVKGDYAQRELAKQIDTIERNRFVVQVYLEKAVRKYNRKSTLVFAADVNHINKLVKTFRDEGVDARGLSAKTSGCERAQVISDFKSGRFPVLVNCAILTEGTDIPPIDCVMLARPTKSSILLQQMIGRGLRLSEGKAFCLILDFEDSVCTKSMMRATLPSLFGLNPNFSIQGKCIGQVIEPLQELKEIPNSLSKMVAKAMSVDDLEKIARDRKLEMELRRFSDPFAIKFLRAEKEWMASRSSFSWVKVQPNIWALNLCDGSKILIEEKNSYNVYFRQKNANTCISSHDSFKSALNHVTTFMVNKYNQKECMSSHVSAEWRNLDMTDKQRLALNNGNIPIWLGMDRGEASDLIQKLTLGAIKLSSGGKQITNG